MIVIRVRGVGDSLRFRLSEWLLGGIMLAWGVTLLFPYPSFATTPTMSGMADLAPELVWGLVCFSIGLGRLWVLFVNGAWRRVHKARAIAACASIAVWFCMLWGALKAGFVTPGPAIYCLYIAADMFTVWRSAADARILDEAAIREAAQDGIA